MLLLLFLLQAGSLESSHRKPSSLALTRAAEYEHVHFELFYLRGKHIYEKNGGFMCSRYITEKLQTFRKYEKSNRI